MVRCGLLFIYLFNITVTTDTNNTNTRENINGAVIVTKSLREISLCCDCRPSNHDNLRL